MQIKQRRIQNPQASLSDGGREGEMGGDMRGICNSQCFLGWYFYCVLLQSGCLPLSPMYTLFCCNLQACVTFTKGGGCIRFSQCSNTWKNLDYPNLVERRLGHFILTNRKGSATLTTELARNPLFSRSVPMKVPVAVRSAAVEHVHGSFAHEIDLLDVLALDLNTNDFPLFFSPHSIFLLLETIAAFLSTENLTVK